MRKISLLTTATFLTAAFLGSQGMTVQAAPAAGSQLPDFDNCKNLPALGNRIIISNDLSKIQDILGKSGVDCDIESILKDYFQNLPSQFPCPPVELPDNTPDTPGTPDTPDIDTPDIDTPDTDLPGDNTPGTPDTPDNDKPGTEIPGSKPETENQAYINRVVELVNIERAKENLTPLSVDLKVQAAAQVRALEIETSFSHTRPNGSSFSTALKDQNVTYRSAGENIAWGQRSPEEVVKGWMNSPGHRANIMDSRYTKIGVGYHRNAKGTNYWSQLFI